MALVLEIGNLTGGVPSGHVGFLWRVASAPEAVHCSVSTVWLISDWLVCSEWLWIHDLDARFDWTSRSAVRSWVL